MGDEIKAILIGGGIGLAIGGLVGSAMFGGWGGVVGSVVGILVGGTTLGILAYGASSIERQARIEEGAEEPEASDSEPDSRSGS